MSRYETPELPAGHYFFVTKQTFRNYYGNRTAYVVHVMRKRKWWLDKSLSRDTACNVDEDDTWVQRRIHNSMVGLAKEINRRNFEGHYPPNKL